MTSRSESSPAPTAAERRFRMSAGLLAKLLADRLRVAESLGSPIVLTWHEADDIRAALATAEPARGSKDRAELERLLLKLDEVVDPGDYLEIAGEVVPWRRSSPGLPGYIAGLRSRAEDAERQLSDISAAIGTCRWMDEPDGGDVPLGEQVRRMRAALDASARETATLTERLARAVELGELLDEADRRAWLIEPRVGGGWEISEDAPTGGGDADVVVLACTRESLRESLHAALRAAAGGEE